ncbi:hypothetical protein ACF07Q_28710 [Nocardiopsis dassonvillei]|uniref:hypothetical protein n=1 Tax=Nocardiopsis dassonvillei TaxID=2014 RepID=UPI0036F641EA
MSAEVKIKGGKPNRRIREALEPHAADMFARPTGTWLAVIEVSHAKRTEEVVTNDDMDFIARSVEVRLSSLEIAARTEDQEALQTILHMLKEQRETAGTLFDPAVRDAGA